MISGSHHGFTKGKLCLTKEVAFYDGVTVLVGNERATDVISYRLLLSLEVFKSCVLEALSAMG